MIRTTLLAFFRFSGQMLGVTALSVCMRTVVISR